jgi:hypothetical protein
VWGDSEAALEGRINAMRFVQAAEKDLDSLRCWVAKIFPDAESVGGLEWLFPGGVFLYIFRNGIDVVHSMSKFHGFRHLSFEGRCRMWSDNTFRYEFLRTHDRTIAIRFEDFVPNPDATFQRVLKLAGLPYETAPTEFAATTLVHPLDQPTMAADPRTVLAQRAPAWTEWREEEKQMFRDICSDAMHALGYKLPF